MVFLLFISYLLWSESRKIHHVDDCFSYDFCRLTRSLTLKWLFLSLPFDVFGIQFLPTPHTKSGFFIYKRRRNVPRTVSIAVVDPKLISRVLPVCMFLTPRSRTENGYRVLSNVYANYFIWTLIYKELFIIRLFPSFCQHSTTVCQELTC